MESSQTLNLLKKYNPIIINSRLNSHGDYDTPEQGIPVVPHKIRIGSFATP
jgi:alpha-L-fucosidase